MAKKKQIKRKKFAFGGKNYMPDVINIPSPTQALYENRKLQEQAELNSENYWTQALDVLAPMLTGVGAQMFQSGISGGELDALGDPFKNMKELPAATVTKAAFGGMMPGLQPVEVEGNEVGELPTGELLDFQGPSHEEGGIPINLPAGTQISSDRIKIDGVSMADRKKKRKRKEVSLQELLEIDSTDAILKSSQERLLQTNENEELFDNQIQELISQLMESQGLLGQEGIEREKFAFGDKVKKLFSNVTSNTSMPTMGDLVGMYGNYKQTQDYLDIVKQNRAGDLPNINPFVNYGKDSLKSLDQMKKGIYAERDQGLQDIQSQTQGMMQKGRNSAGSINTMRALDLAANALGMSESSKLRTNMLRYLGDVQKNIAETQRAIDDKFMTAEGERMTADKQDRDAFYSELLNAKMLQGQNISNIGKNMNVLKDRAVRQNLLQSMYPYVKADGTSGFISATDVEAVADFNFTDEELQSWGIDPKDWKENPKNRGNLILSAANVEEMIKVVKSRD